MKEVSREKIIGRLFVIASETGKSINEVVEKAKEMLEEEMKRTEATKSSPDVEEVVVICSKHGEYDALMTTTAEGRKSYTDCPKCIAEKLLIP